MFAVLYYFCMLKKLHEVIFHFQTVTTQMTDFGFRVKYLK